MTIHEAVNRLATILSAYRRLAVAVSGGVDSLTLAAFAHLHVPDVTLFHARSAAVPADAAKRLLELAGDKSWLLRFIDAGELQDERYRQNPVDRCYYCKQNLYRTIRDNTDAQVVSGTNCDDLEEYRPGLDAAAEAGVVHPFVEAGFSKAMIRQLALSLGMPTVSALPASPCLSSRVRTGIAIQPDLLKLVDATENLLRARLRDCRDVRCRIHAKHLVLQLSTLSFPESQRWELEEGITRLFHDTPWECLTGRIEWAVYVRGSAFIAQQDASHESSCA